MCVNSQSVVLSYYVYYINSLAFMNLKRVFFNPPLDVFLVLVSYKWPFMSQTLHKSQVFKVHTFVVVTPNTLADHLPFQCFSCLCPHLKHLWSLHSKLLEISYRTGSFKPSSSNNKNSAEVGFMYEVYLKYDIFHQSVC